MLGNGLAGELNASGQLNDHPAVHGSKGRGVEEVDRGCSAVGKFQIKWLAISAFASIFHEVRRVGWWDGVLPPSLGVLGPLLSHLTRPKPPFPIFLSNL
jgi:hypothetical protein